jgi:ElaB/YqjD/DUF883 family membrane-anchored ribosome-binding protein
VAKNKASGNQPTEGNDLQADVEQAEQRVREAREALQAARREYEQLIERVAEVDRPSSAESVSHAVDETLKLVKKYPGPGVLTAALAGFFLGRLFRRF